MLRVESVSGVCSVMTSAREGDNLHLQPQCAVGDDRADVARADQPEGFGGQLDPHEAVLLPLARLGRGIGLGQLAREREHQRDRVLGGGD